MLSRPCIVVGGIPAAKGTTMARQETVTVVDDLDGSEAAGTVDFALEGKSYEIDLSEKNTARLRDTLAEFVAAARRAGGRGRRAHVMSDVPARANREETAAIREWARQNGHEVAERGRIPKNVVEAYQQTH